MSRPPSPKTRVLTVELRNRLYDIHRCRIRCKPDVPGFTHVDGDCSNPDCPPHFYIRVDQRLRGRDLAETLIHELLHAADYDKSEEWVSEIAAAITEALFSDPFHDLIYDAA